MSMATKHKLKPVVIDKILLFGDSITEQSSNQAEGFGLAPALQHEYWSKLQVITHGYGGYNSEHGRWMIDPILDAEMGTTRDSQRGTVRVMTIFFGTNDAAASDNTMIHVPLPRYSENIEFIATRAIQRGVKVIIIGPGPINELAPDPQTDRDTLRAKAYSDAGSKVAAKLQIPFVDLWQGFMTKAGWDGRGSVPGRKTQTHDSADIPNGNADVQADKEVYSRFAALLSTDGVHYSQYGYRLWFDLLLATIRSKWPVLRTESMKTVFPHIFQLDNANLPASLWAHIDTRDVVDGSS